MSKDPNLKNKLQEQLDTLLDTLNEIKENEQNFAKLMRKITLIQKKMISEMRLLH